MKAKEIQKGHTYVAKVSGKLTRVRVDEIGTRWNSKNRSSTVYHVTNLRTNRKLMFRSAQKFRSEVVKETENQSHEND